MTSGWEVEWCCTTRLTQSNLIYYGLTYSALELGQFARHTLGPYQLYLLWTIIFINIAIYLALTEASIREGNGTPLQYSCLENPMDGGAWWAAIHGVAKSRTQMSDFTFTFHFHALEKEMATHPSVLAWRIPGTGEPGGCRLWGRTESDTTEAT